MFLQDFSKRSIRAELMDDLSVDFVEFSNCLKGLSRVNQLTLARRPTLHFMKKVMALARSRENPLRILDVGSGYGDMLVFLEKWSIKHKLNIEFIGVDLNPHATKAAQLAAPKESKIRYITANALDFNIENDIDIIISSLFAHHLSDNEIIIFIQWMNKTAKLGWFVNDLYRHPLAYYSFFILSRLGNFHRFVQHDGPVSIARSFQEADWEKILHAAKIECAAVSIVKWFPFRLCLESLKIP